MCVLRGDCPPFEEGGPEEDGPAFKPHEVSRVIDSDKTQYT